ncbi:MAG: ribonuclease HII [Alphaproteobacteria bacterium]|nr:ribonuclease HII [Alphaproteobacteria bacterium]
MPTFQIESQFQGPVGGVDEAGRGPWAGPVVAAVAVFLKPPPQRLEDAIQDSKKLSKTKRESIFKSLHELENFVFAIGKASVAEIDLHNILQATFLAMRRAVQALPFAPPTLLIDGKFIPKFDGIEVHPVIGGDGKSLSIAAASILAKVTRDQDMEVLARECPHYGWERNSGYGTAEHQESLKKHGVTHHHRKSFAPIRALLNPC